MAEQLSPSKCSRIKLCDKLEHCLLRAAAYCRRYQNKKIKNEKQQIINKKIEK